MITVTGIGIADTPGSFVTRPLTSVALDWGGIAGDRHHGLLMAAGVRQKHHPKGTEIRNARQISILADEELAQISATLGIARIAWEWLGGNLCLAGLPSLTQLAPSSRLKFPSGATLVVDGENEPCANPGRVVVQQLGLAPEIASRFVKAAWHKRGLVAWVERPGLIAVGNAVDVIAP